MDKRTRAGRIDELSLGAWFDAAAAGDVAKLERFLALGMDPNRRSPGHLGKAVSEPGDFALLAAAGAGRARCVELLLAAGADPNMRCLTHSTDAAGCAAAEGRLECLEILAAAGARLDEPNNYGMTPAVLAARSQWAAEDALGCLAFLAERGARLEPGDGRAGALHEAARCGPLACLAWLVERGCELDALDWRGEAPTQVAMAAARPEHLRALLEAGAKVAPEAGGARRAPVAARDPEAVEACERLAAERRAMLEAREIERALAPGVKLAAGRRPGL